MRILSLFCLSALCLCSCKKDKYEDPFSYDTLQKKNAGSMGATVNGNTWQSNIVFAKVNPNSPQGKLIIEGVVYDNGIQKQSLVLNFVNPNLKEQKIYSNRIPTWGDNYTPRPLDSLTGGFYLSMGDVGENNYDIVSSEDNMLYIDNYNPASSEIKGHYNMTLYRLDATKKPQTQGFPDTVRISNGTFNVKYSN